MRIPSLFASLTLLSLLASCQAPGRNVRPWMDDPRLRDWQHLNSAKAEMALHRQDPQMQEFKGCGTMFVWSHSLEGGPGWEYLRISYTYKNTSEQKHDWIRVWCEVLDPAGRIVNRGEDLLIEPMGYAHAPGDVWSDVIKVPTRGAHLQKGWSWRIGCRPVRMKVLPPVRD
ncbi:MAG: hypothetical protein KDC87_20110 [Planctomycetes bacterium]|nr:hypothetical protein [Planctomycetota bacterium]MCB9872209.1 hypothetical protein [Planctomycetota bacterium]MCB9888245.1 hypothetical protein [Planctomycetota bacterium]